MVRQNNSQSLESQSLTYVCRYLRVSELTPTNCDIKVHIQRISNHMPTLYQWLKIMIFLYKYQVPFATAIKALQLTELMLSTCEIPIINLIQVYLVPYIYIAARHHASQLQKKKVVNPNSSYSKLHYEYESRCFVTIIEWALIKQKRLYQNQQMLQNSLFYECMKKLTYIVVNGKPAEKNVPDKPDGIDNLIQSDWKDYVREICMVGSELVIENAQIYKRKFKEKLSKYGNHETCPAAEKYSAFFIQKLRSEIRSQFKQRQQKQQRQPTISNQPFNPTQIYATILQSFRFPIRGLPKLDIYHLFQTLDPVLTYPLNQIVFQILQSQQLDLFVMKQAVRILGWLIRWGDLEAYLNVVYSQQISHLAQRMLEIKGFISLTEGQNIFPEITDKLNKLPFYLQFLNFIQIVSTCKITQIDQQLPPIKLRKIRKQLQQQQFIFPQNLSFHKIKIQFNLNIKAHTQRNQIFFTKIQNMNVKQSIKQVSRSLTKDKGKQRKGKMETVRNSLALVDVLEDQLLDLIQSIESKYSSIKGKSNIQLLVESKESVSDISVLREQILLLEQQISLNDQQDDPCISERLKETTQKGRKLLFLISVQIPSIYKPSSCKSNNNKKQLNNHKSIMEKSHYCLQQGQFVNTSGLMGKAAYQPGSIDNLSDVILASATRIIKPKVLNKEEEGRNNRKQKQEEISNNQQKILNIQSIKSQYGLTESALNQNMKASQKQNRKQQSVDFSLSNSKIDNYCKRIDQVTPKKVDPQVKNENLSSIGQRLTLKLNKNASAKKRKQLGQNFQVKMNEDYFNKGKFKDCIRQQHQELQLQSALSYLTARSRSRSQKMKLQKLNSQNYLIGIKLKQNTSNTCNRRESAIERQCENQISERRAMSQNQRKHFPVNIQLVKLNTLQKKHEQLQPKQQNPQKDRNQQFSRKQSSSQQKYIKLGQGHRKWNKKQFRQNMVLKCKDMGMQIR